MGIGVCTMAANDNASEPHGLSGLIGGFADDIKAEIRKELRSARDEMAEKAKTAGAGAGMHSGSLIGALFTLGSLTALLIIALALVMPLWLSALIVTVLWGIATAVLALSGKKKLQESTPFIPERTIENVKEDVEWTKERVTSPKK